MIRYLPLLLVFACMHAFATPAAPTPQDIVDQANRASARPLSRGATGAAVLRAQVLLDRAHFSPGQIDGVYGSSMRQAVAGLQRSRGLRVTGRIDAATWKAIEDDTLEATLASYTVEPDDVAGPFEAVPEKMEDKAKLATLGFESPLEALAEKFHASPGLLKRLNPGKDFGQVGVSIIVPNVLGAAPPPKAGRIVVDESDRSLRLYDTAGKLVAQFPSSTGSEFDPLPIGKWKVEGITRDPDFYYNPKLFWDAEPDEKKTKVAAGPNNPVGVAWIDLSKPHYGIHGAPEPASIGKTQSHGCIRLTNWDVARLASSVAAGTEVVLQR